MLYFLSDYTEGAHPAVLRALEETNLVSLPGYGEDEICERAKAKIRAACGREDLDVFFLSGGTQTNLVVISALLRRWEAVLCAETGHIAVHEAGAVEFTGHKVIPLPAAEGKLPAAELEKWLARFFADATHTHMPYPGMVYISQPTELGTLYSKAELDALYGVCRRYSLPLFVDGARLGYGLMSPANDLSLPELAQRCDVFYIGGTKVGALFGEAVVITNDALKTGFRYMIKQRGGMLAKGRLLGVQFREMFTDGLYEAMGRHAIDASRRLKAIFEREGYPFACDSPTNQQFPILPDATLEKLSADFAFSFWGRADASHSVVRFCTSWATTAAELDALEAALKQAAH